MSSNIHFVSYNDKDPDNGHYLRSYQKNSILVKHTILLKSICRYGEYCFVLHSSQQSSPLEMHLQQYVKSVKEQTEKVIFSKSFLRTMKKVTYQQLIEQIPDEHIPPGHGTNSSFKQEVLSMVISAASLSKLQAQHFFPFWQTYF